MPTTVAPHHLKGEELFGLQSLSLLRRTLKTTKLAAKKVAVVQPLTNSVLNPRSPELWRMKVEEKTISADPGVAKSGGLPEKPRHQRDVRSVQHNRRSISQTEVAEGVGLGSNVL